MTVQNKFISVTSVSNPAINVIASDDGANGLKITFSNPSNDIKTETNFTFQLTYTQDAINNKIILVEQAKYIPASSDQLPIVNTNPVSSITLTSASSGGSITNDRGEAITDKGICYGIDTNPEFSIINTNRLGPGTSMFASTITGLEPGKIYHVRAFAFNQICVSGMGMIYLLKLLIRVFCR